MQAILFGNEALTEARKLSGAADKGKTVALTLRLVRRVSASSVNLPVVMSAAVSVALSAFGHFQQCLRSVEDGVALLCAQLRGSAVSICLQTPAKTERRAAPNNPVGHVTGRGVDAGKKDANQAWRRDGRSWVNAVHERRMRVDCSIDSDHKH